MVDVYQRAFLRLILPKYWLRPITTRLSHERLFEILERATPSLMSLSNTLGQMPLMGSILKRLVPVANYTGVYPLTPEQILEWAILDTFDWLSPQYDQPQIAATLERWFEEAGLTHIEIEKAGHLVGRGRKVAK